ncbi:MAG: tRNA (adenosine(37)-N6)-threonylcarbamoyltransferase complex ATPase subunit type 1 TsaE [candidate division FCPU426 bacterium]
MSTRFFETQSAEETRRLGALLSAELGSGDVLLLSGELGSGKTCFCTGLAGGLGSSMEVSSPTFTLINEYRGGRLPMFHVDLYRLKAGPQVLDLGLEEYFEGPGVSVVEWPERLGQLKPPQAWEIAFRHGGGDLRLVEVRKP